MDASVLNYTVNDNVASFLNKNQKTIYLGVSGLTQAPQKHLM